LTVAAPSERHEHVARFDVAMDDALLVRVLNRFARLREEPQPIGDVQAVAIAVLRDRHARDVLHDEVGAAVGRRPRVVHRSDVRMVHQRESLALGFEPRDDLARVHPELDQLERDTPADRRLLIGEVHDPHAAFADLPEHAIRTDFPRPVKLRVGRLVALFVRRQRRALHFGAVDPQRQRHADQALRTLVPLGKRSSARRTSALFRHN